MRTKILVSCEYTGAFTNALIDFGFDAVSCDILPSKHSKNHIQGNVIDLLHSTKWLALFGFPPCTYLSKAGLHYCNLEKYGVKGWERIKQRNEAVDFFLEHYFLDVPFHLLENPIGFISSTIIKPTQIISPHLFGDSYRKDTCLWLKGFQPLIYSDSYNLFSEKTSFDLVTQIWANGKNKCWVDCKTKKQRSVMSTIMAEEIVKQLAPQLRAFLDDQQNGKGLYLPKESVQTKI